MSEMAGGEQRPPRQVRGMMNYFFLFFVSLALGKGVDVLLSADAMLAANRWQQGIYRSVSAMAPLSLASNYLHDLTLDYQHRPWGLSDSEIARMEDASDAALANASANDCVIAEETAAGAHPFSGGSLLLVADAGICRHTARASDPVCTHSIDAALPVLLAQAAEPESGSRPSLQDMESPPINDSIIIRDVDDLKNGGGRPLPGPAPPAPGYEPPRDRTIGGILATPAVALLRAWMRLTYPGGWSYLWALAQLGAGFLVWRYIHGYVMAGPRRQGRWPDGLLGWAIGMPVGIVLGASAVAAVLKYLMLGGLAAFGWFTCLAGMACAAAGLLGTSWWLVVKFAEYASQAEPPRTG